MAYKIQKQIKVKERNKCIKRTFSYHFEKPAAKIIRRDGQGILLAKIKEKL